MPSLVNVTEVKAKVGLVSLIAEQMELVISMMSYG